MSNVRGDSNLPSLRAKVQVKALTFLSPVLLLSGLFAGVAAAVSVDGADLVIKSYISAEEEQDYAQIYRLLSVARKKQLKRVNSVGDAASYVSLRRSSEARWFNFVEKGRRESKGKMVVTFEVVIEENGERENDTVNITLLFQGGQWWIEAIDY